MPFDREREMFKATCGDCGNECELPFKPKDDRPVYCRECFQKHKPQERSGSRFSRGSGDTRRREMFKATCGDCGNECEVPFKPKDDRPVYCKECFQSHRPQERSGSRFGRSDRGSRFSRGSGDTRRREMFKATCGDCGNECEVPFKPKEDRPVYCKDCFQTHREN